MDKETANKVLELNDEKNNITGILEFIDLASLEEDIGIGYFRECSHIKIARKTVSNIRFFLSERLKQIEKEIEEL